jgi:hypothetical protein
VKTRCMLILYLILGYALEAPSQGTLHILLEIGADYERNQYGHGVLGLPDINNDGWPDLAVSSFTLAQTLIYFGGPGILDDTADVRLRGGGLLRKGDVNGGGPSGGGEQWLQALVTA